jgi:hypothetical protein
MIQLRKADGTSIQLDEPGMFVELINDLDQTVMLSFVQPQPGTILMIKPGTADAMNYEQIFSAQGVKFSKSMTEGIGL